jgi:sortase (surface protein transpeptidase)
MSSLDDFTRGSLSAAAAAIAMISVGVALFIGDRPAPAAPMSVERIQAAQVATPTPKPTPAPYVPPIGAATRPSNECPQMNNPGGRLNWGPTPQTGPSATGGTIRLPTLGVSAPIVRVGIDAQNKMVVPHNAKDVAWLDRGGIPGYTNNLVMAGHISYSRVPGSFIRIGDLRPGDEVRIDLNGEKRQYRVQWVCLFSRTTERAEQVMGYTDVPSLTLISCGGGWDAGARTHTGRYAVRAVQVVDGKPVTSERASTASAGTSPTPEPMIDLSP